ncbi:hypothetical protein TWF281_008989 [Arthrobotrys megalospora]
MWERHKVLRSKALEYMEYQTRYLEGIAPLIRLATHEASNEFRVGWDDDIEEQYQRGRVQQAEEEEEEEAQPQRLRAEAQEGGGGLGFEELIENGTGAQQARQEGREAQQETGLVGRRFSELMEESEDSEDIETESEEEEEEEEEQQYGQEEGEAEVQEQQAEAQNNGGAPRFQDLMDASDVSDEDELLPPAPPSLVKLLDEIQPVLKQISKKLRRVNYNVVPFVPEAQRRNTGEPFNYRLLNEEVKTRTIDALETLTDFCRAGPEGWDIKINEDFAVDEWSTRRDGRMEPHVLLYMLERFIIELNNAWVVPHDLRTIFAYIYSIADYRPRKGRERPDDGDYIIIDLNGALEYSNNLEALSGGVGSYLAGFKQIVNNAFKYLPKTRLELLEIQRALGMTAEIKSRLEFYNKFLVTFYRNVKAMANRPYESVGQRHHTVVQEQRAREQLNQANALNQLNQLNQQNQANLLNQFNQQNQGNQLNINQADMVNQLGQIDLRDQWQDQ